MEINTFIEQIKSQFIDAEEITLLSATEFRTISSWDSLTGMAILVMIKDEYNVEMSDDDLKFCKTVQEIYNFVEKSL